MVCDGLEPAAKGKRWVIRERPQVLAKLYQDLLGHVLSVGFLKVPLPAPAVNVWAVTINKLKPAGMIVRILSQPDQQGYACSGERLDDSPFFASMGHCSDSHFGARCGQENVPAQWVGFVTAQIRTASACALP